MTTGYKITTPFNSVLTFQEHFGRNKHIFPSLSGGKKFILYILYIHYSLHSQEYRSQIAKTLVVVTFPYNKLEGKLRIICIQNIPQEFDKLKMKIFGIAWDFSN